jgi:hypothetical protein
MLVLALVSSMMTRREGSSLRSVALPLRSPPGHVGSILLAGVQTFFEADPLVLEEVPDREVVHLDPAISQLRRECPSRYVRLLPPREPATSHARLAERKDASKNQLRWSFAQIVGNHYMLTIKR